MRAANTADDFFAKVDRNGPIPAHCPELGPCHVWTGCTSSGYGRFRFLGKLDLTHRVAFFLAHGRWPEPCALHRCDNRACVNDGHLFEGTKADNAADRNAKGRTAKGDHVDPEKRARGERHGRKTHPSSTARGERTGSSKLTEQDVLDIRSEYARGVTMTAIGARRGVSKSTVRAIVVRRTWAHVQVSAPKEGAKL
jgi:hypothetical protein